MRVSSLNKLLYIIFPQPNVHVAVRSSCQRLPYHQRVKACVGRKLGECMCVFPITQIIFLKIIFSIFEIPHRKVFNEWIYECMNERAFQYKNKTWFIYRSANSEIEIVWIFLKQTRRWKTLVLSAWIMEQSWCALFSHLVVYYTSTRGTAAGCVGFKYHSLLTCEWSVTSSNITPITSTERINKHKRWLNNSQV